MKIQSYRELDVWKKGIDIVDNVYEVTKKFPVHVIASATLRRSPYDSSESIGPRNDRKAQLIPIYNQ